NENIVVVAGDAAFTCGISYEALNNVKSHTKRFIVVLNDNEWSIAKNVGAIANYLNSIATSPTFAHLHDKARDFVRAIAGKSVAKFAHKVEESVKGLIVPSVIFEELGLRYYGPIDGHDIPLLIRTFEFLKTQDEPVLLHILTKKGKGYEPAIKQPDKFHGLGKYKLETGETAPTPTPTYSEIIGKTLAKFAETNQKIVAITAAMPSGTGLSHFAKAHPSRYFDVGIAEEHATLFARGLATQGWQPWLRRGQKPERALTPAESLLCCLLCRVSNRWTPACSNRSCGAWKSCPPSKTMRCTTALAARQCTLSTRR